METNDILVRCRPLPDGTFSVVMTGKVSEVSDAIVRELQAGGCGLVRDPAPIVFAELEAIPVGTVIHLPT